MKERPILMNGEMVRAILDKRKTQTRRPVKPQPQRFGDEYHCGKGHYYVCKVSEYPLVEAEHSPFGVPGDRLWTRETARRKHAGVYEEWGISFATYVADCTPVLAPDGKSRAHWWYSKDVCPSIHMPRWASRLTLEVERVWCERLHDMCFDDAIAEGVAPIMMDSGGFTPWDTPIDIPDYFQGFARTWDSIYANKRGLRWDDDPWVFACEFKVLEVCR